MPAAPSVTRMGLSYGGSIMTLRSVDEDVDLCTPVDVAIKTRINQEVDV